MRLNASVWLVIGYGNMLRSDDGFGVRVAQELREKDIAQLAKIIATQQLLPELAEPISRADGVIFIDIDASLAAGTFNCIAVSEDMVCRQEATFTHHITPQRLLSDARMIFGCAPAGFLYSAGSASLALGEHLSPQVEALVPEIAQLIFDKIQSAVTVDSA